MIVILVRMTRRFPKVVDEGIGMIAWITVLLVMVMLLMNVRGL